MPKSGFVGRGRVRLRRRDHGRRRGIFETIIWTCHGSRLLYQEMRKRCKRANGWSISVHRCRCYATTTTTLLAKRESLLDTLLYIYAPGCWMFWSSVWRPMMAQLSRQCSQLSCSLNLTSYLCPCMICLKYWRMACKYWTCLCVALSVSQSSRVQGRKILVDLSRTMYGKKMIAGRSVIDLLS